jgi:hypothetical protein
MMHRVCGREHWPARLCRAISWSLIGLVMRMDGRLGVDLSAGRGVEP